MRAPATFACALLALTALPARAGAEPGSITFVVLGVDDDLVGCPAPAGAGTLNVPTLRCAIQGANANAGFADTIEFDIPTGMCPGGVCVITIDDTDPLPAITEALTIDGRSETTNAGVTHSGSVGLTEKAGVDDVQLSPVTGVTIGLLDGGGGHAYGLRVTGDDVTVKGVAVYGFGDLADGEHANVAAIGDDFLLEDSIIGLSPTGTNPAPNGGRGLYLGGAGATASKIIVNLSTEGSHAVALDGGDTAIERSQIALPGSGTANVLAEGGTVDGCYIYGANLVSIEADAGATITNTTIQQFLDTHPKIRLVGDGNTVTKTVISDGIDEDGVSILVQHGATGNSLRENRFGNVTGFGIDLLDSDDDQDDGTAPYLTLNDNGDTDGLTNFPVIDEAYVVEGGTKVAVAGFARPGATIDLYESSVHPSGHGPSGRRVHAAVEGSGTDQVATTGSYDDATSGKDTTNRFRFVFTRPAYVVGDVTKLTATATVSGSTSEFALDTLVRSDPADLSVVLLSDTPDPVATSGTIQYTFIVSGNGGRSTASQTVTLELGAGASFESGGGSDSWACAASTASKIVCTRAAMLSANGGSTLNVEVNAPASEGTLSTTVTVSHPEVDAVAANDTIVVTTTVDEPSGADLHPTVDVAATAGPGDAVPLAITVVNDGPLAASDVEVEVILPSGSAYVGAQGTGWACSGTGPVTCTRTSLGVTSSPTLTIDTTAPSAEGEAGGSVSVSSGTDDPAAGNDSVMFGYVVEGDHTLGVTIDDAPDPVSLEGTVTYTVSVTNQGPDAASPLSLDVTITNGATITAGAGSGWSCAMAPNHGKRPQAAPTGWRCTRTALASGASASFTVTATAPEDDGPFELVIARGQTTLATETTTASAIVATANLGVTLTDAPDPVATGAALVYALRVENAGPDAATSVSAVLNLPVGAAYVGTTAAGWTCALAAGKVTCTKASLAADAVETVHVALTAPAVAGMITAAATVSSATSDDDAGDNAASASTMVVLPTSTADLAVDLVAPAKVEAGGAIAYVITLSNAGPDAAAGVTAALVLGDGVAYTGATGATCAEDGGTVTCAVGAMSSGGSAVVTITATAPADAGAVTATAAVASTAADGDTGDNTEAATTMVTITADLVATLVAAPEPVVEGGTITYTLTVQNAGPSAATDVVAALTLPAGATFGSAAGAGWTCAAAGLVVTCGRDTLAVGTSAITVMAVAPAAGAGAIEADAEVTGGSTDPTPDDAAASATITVLDDAACAVDADCGGPSSGTVCVAQACTAGCRGAGGNGCPGGKLCTSSSDAVGACVTPPSVDAGVPDAGLPDAGLPDAPGAAPDATADARPPSSPDAAIAGESSGGCTVAPRGPGASLLLLGALMGIVARPRRRRRA